MTRAIPQHTKGKWVVNADLISTPTGSVAQILPCDEEAANALLIAAAPDLLQLAGTFRSTCRERIAALRNLRDGFNDEDAIEEINGEITEWKLRLCRCEETIDEATAG